MGTLNILFKWFLDVLCTIIAGVILLLLTRRIANILDEIKEKKEPAIKYKTAILGPNIKGKKIAIFSCANRYCHYYEKYNLNEGGYKKAFEAAIKEKLKKDVIIEKKVDKEIQKITKKWNSLSGREKRYIFDKIACLCVKEGIDYIFYFEFERDYPLDICNIKVFDVAVLESYCNRGASNLKDIEKKQGMPLKIEWEKWYFEKLGKEIAFYIKKDLIEN